MSEQTFADAEQQILVRLSEENLAYIPAGQAGWQCRISDIGWTSSEIGPRAIQQVEFYAPDGRRVVTLPHFQQIERFYLLLLRQMTARPFFDSVRDSLPGLVPLLERVVWLAGHTTEADTPWVTLLLGDGAVVVATPAALLVAPPGDLRLERIPWRELAGVRSRGSLSRFYRADSYVEVELRGAEEQLGDLCRRHRQSFAGEGADFVAHEMPGITAEDDDVTMTYSWEIEKARDAGLLLPDEQVLACAFGTGTGTVAPGMGPALDTPDPLEAAGAALTPAPGSAAPPLRTELFLTDRRLLQVNRHRLTEELIAHFEVGIDHLPVIHRRGLDLILGRLELRPDAGSPVDLTADFMQRYRALLTEYFDPFVPKVEIAIPGELPTPPEATDLPDPFAPTLEAVPGRPGARRPPTL